MGFLSVLKKIGKGALVVGKHAVSIAAFVPIPGVPPALQAKAISLIKAGVAVAEAKGGENKIKTARDAIIPALIEAGIHLPEKKINLLIDLILDEDYQEDVFKFDEKKAAAVAKANQEAKLAEIAAKLEELDAA